MQTFRISERAVRGLRFIVERDRDEYRQNSAHRHDGIEIMFSRRGAGFCSVNEHTFPLVPGDFYPMGVNDTHAFFFRHDGDYCTVAFYRDAFTPEELHELEKFDCFAGISRDDFSFRSKYTFPPSVCETLFGLLDTIREELKNDLPMSGELARSLLLQFLILAGRKSAEAAGLAFSGDLVGEILGYVAEHYAENISLDTLGRRFGYSAEYTGRAFKRKTGMNFTEYLTFFRIEKSCVALEKSPAGISEIAVMCGFFDNSHFCRKFKHIIGIPPSEYRARRRKGRYEV